MHVLIIKYEWVSVEGKGFLMNKMMTGHYWSLLFKSLLVTFIHV